MTTRTREAALTRVRVEAAPAGRVRVLTSVDAPPGAPALRPVLLGSDERSARVSLVPDGALLLAGDRVAVGVDVGPGVRLTLVEPAGTVAYDMPGIPGGPGGPGEPGGPGAEAAWDVDLRLDDGATLVWPGEPFVVAAGARVRRSTRVRLGTGARLAVRETLVLGRHGEGPGRATVDWSAVDADGRPLVVERLDLDGAGGGAARPGVLGGHRVVGSVVALGVTVPPEAAPAGRLDLHRGGTTWRHLAAQAHLLPGGSWEAARAAAVSG